MLAYTFLLRRNQQLSIPPFTIEMLDSTGSASACAGAMLSRWTEYDFVEILCDEQLVATVYRETELANPIVIPRVWPVRGSSPLH